MALAIDASSSFTDGDTTENPYVGPEIDAPADALLAAWISSFATSGDDDSTIAPSMPGTAWTKAVGLDQLNNGGSVAPPPVGFHTAEAPPDPEALTQTTIDGLGFAQLQGVWVFTGAHPTTPVADTGTFTGTGAVDIEVTTPVDGCYVLFGMVDWSNSSDVPVKSNASMNVRKSGADGDQQAHLLAELFCPTAGTYHVGTNALASPQGTNALAIVIQPADDVDPAEGTAGLAIEFIVAATGTATHEGTTAPAIELELAASGATDHEGQASPGVELALAASGSTVHEGAASPGIVLTVQAAGERPAQGSAAITLEIAPSARGGSFSPTPVLTASTGAPTLTATAATPTLTASI